MVYLLDLEMKHPVIQAKQKMHLDNGFNKQFS